MEIAVLCAVVGEENHFLKSTLNPFVLLFINYILLINLEMSFQIYFFFTFLFCLIPKTPSLKPRCELFAIINVKWKTKIHCHGKHFLLNNYFIHEKKKIIIASQDQFASCCGVFSLIVGG